MDTCSFTNELMISDTVFSVKDSLRKDAKG